MDQVLRLTTDDGDQEQYVLITIKPMDLTNKDAIALIFKSALEALNKEVAVKWN